MSTQAERSKEISKKLESYWDTHMLETTEEEDEIFLKAIVALKGGLTSPFQTGDTANLTFVK